MLARYQRPSMKKIFSEENKFASYLKVELLATRAWNELGVVPAEDLQCIEEKANFDLKGIKELEEITKHDVIAFTRNVSSYLGEEKKWIHYGLTSTDIVDTAYGLLYQQANEIIEAGLLRMRKVLASLAWQYKDVPCIGRTHGVHATISSFGLKFALWFDEFGRHLERFSLARKMIEVGKLSGAVGTFAHTPPFVQDFVCSTLGLSSSPISTQTLQRDRHAEYFATLALIASSIEKMGIEIRHLSRTEVKEVEEYFSSFQKGSSAMPHKRNPIASENMAGCARLMRGYMHTAYENIALWHERDISHSSAERVLSEDATSLLDYMLHRFANVLENLTIFKDKIEQNINLTYGVVFAQDVLTLLIDKGSWSREEAYDLIQSIAMQSLQDKISFLQLLRENNKVVSALGYEMLENVFDIQKHLHEVNNIYKRIDGLADYKKS